MTFRILSLDGGGSWALIQVKALIALYSATTPGHRVLEDFDLAVANSGGSIVLGGLIENLTLAQILAVFEDERQRRAVFSPTKMWGDRILRDLTGMGPKYDAAAKLVALQKALPSRSNLPLTQAAAGIRRPGTANDLHVVIASFDYDRNRARFFRSAVAGSAAAPYWGQGAAADITLADAIHASSNAPINYFDSPAQWAHDPGRYWDGAITGCNNPIVAGITEAIVLRQSEKTPADVVALSIGTGTVARPWPALGQAPSVLIQSPSETGLVNDLRKIAGAILDDPPDIATYLAYVMTGGPWNPKVDPQRGRIVRMNPLVSPVRNGPNWAPPKGMTLDQFAYLANLDMDAIEQHEVDAIGVFADLWLQSRVPNQPVRMDEDTLTLEVGDGWFSEAVGWWEKIK
jgi:Patatin-like phospholipase